MYYSNYQRDLDDQEYRKAHRPSALFNLFWLVLWFILIVAFA